MWLEDIFKGGAKGIVEGVGEAVQKAASAFKADPTKVAEFDMEIQRIKAEAINKIDEHEAAMAKLAADDRNSARQREIAVKDWTPSVLGWSIVIGYFAVQWFLLNHIIPTEMREVILRTLGTLDMALGLVLGYYYGSSSSSDKKTGALVGQLNKE